MTVVDHDMRAGGRITFRMDGVGAEGEPHNSTWAVIAADPPHYLELRDTDVDDDGRPNDGNAMTAFLITIDERDGGGAVMAIRTHFDSLAGMGTVLATGVEEGMRIVLSQVDAVLAGAPAWSADTGPDGAGPRVRSTALGHLTRSDSTRGLCLNPVPRTATTRSMTLARNVSCSDPPETPSAVGLHPWIPLWRRSTPRNHPNQHVQGHRYDH